jgi:hypothetical protein
VFTHREDSAVVSLQIPDRNPTASRESALVNETLNTSDTVRACVVLVRKLKPTPETLSGGETPAKPFLQLVGLLDLGQGVNGYPGTAHGGFFNVMLDEIMGSTVNSYTADSGEWFPFYCSSCAGWFRIYGQNPLASGRRWLI